MCYIESVPTCCTRVPDRPTISFRPRDRRPFDPPVGVVPLGDNAAHGQALSTAQGFPSVSQSIRAVLRNASGEHLTTLNADELAFYEALAEQEKVFRFTKIKKGRPCIIFRLKPETAAEIIASLAHDTSCSLTESDSRWISGEMGEPSRAQQERWIGWGLVTA